MIAFAAIANNVATEIVTVCNGKDRVGVAFERVNMAVVSYLPFLPLRQTVWSLRWALLLTGYELLTQQCRRFKKVIAIVSMLSTTEQRGCAGTFTEAGMQSYKGALTQTQFPA